MKRCFFSKPASPPMSRSFHKGQHQGLSNSGGWVGVLVVSEGRTRAHEERCERRPTARLRGLPPRSSSWTVLGKLSGEVSYCRFPPRCTSSTRHPGTHRTKGELWGAGRRGEMSPPSPHSCLRNIDGVLSHLKTDVFVLRVKPREPETLLFFSLWVLTLLSPLRWTFCLSPPHHCNDHDC